MLPMLKWAHYARKLDIGLLCPNIEIRPRPTKMEFFKNLSFLWKGLQISLTTSPQPPPDTKFKSSYARKRDFGYYAQIWKFGPRLPKMEFFKKVLFFWKGLQTSLPTSPQPPPDIKFKSSYARKRGFGLLCPSMENRSQAPKNWIFQKNFIFLKRSSNFASISPQPPADIKFKSSYVKITHCQKSWI